MENRIKEDLCVYFETCEKVDPEFTENALTSGLNVEFKHRSSPIPNNEDLVSPKIEYDCELSSPSSNLLLKLSKHGSNEEIIVKHEVNDCTYFNDSIVVDNFSYIRNIHEVVEEKLIGEERQLNNSNKKPKLIKQVLYCYHCSFSTKFRGNLLRHMKFKHMPTPLLKCPSCPIKFRYHCDLKRHSSKHVELAQRKCKYNCSFCNFKTDKKFNFARHIFRGHIFDLPVGCFEFVKKCPFCSFETDVKSNLLSHFINKHKLDFIQRRQKNSIFPCGLCSYFSTCMSSLISHIDGYHKKIRPHACHLCDYAANKPTDLRIHISAKHDKITPFNCEKCSYASAYKKHLRRHILSQHINKKDK